MHADLALMKCLSQPPRLTKSQQVQYVHGHRGERFPVRCSGASHHEDTGSSASEQAVKPGHVTISRRRALLAATCACIAARCAPANAAIIDEAQAQEIFEQVSESVVSIANVKQTGGEEVVEGTGSGFIWTQDGFVVTNYHCVASLAADRRGQQAVLVQLTNPDSSTTDFPAELVGTDPQHDIAVLRIRAGGRQLRGLPLGTAYDLRVGQALYAIGNPLGSNPQTLTAGLVSGLDRAVPSPVGTLTPGAIQTDAAISAGNSGGPLLDSAGRVVGMNTATFTQAGSGRSSGVNFALPIDLIRKTVPSLIMYGNAAGKGFGINNS